MAAQTIFCPTIIKAIANVTSNSQCSISSLGANPETLTDDQGQMRRSQASAMFSDDRRDLMAPFQSQESILWKKLHARLRKDRAPTKLKTRPVSRPCKTTGCLDQERVLFEESTNANWGQWKDPICQGRDGNESWYDAGIGNSLDHDKQAWEQGDTDDSLMNDIDDRW